MMAELVRRVVLRVGLVTWKLAATVFHFAVTRLFIVGLLVLGMVAFFALALGLLIVLSPLGVSDQTIAAVAGATVLLTPWILLARLLVGK